jgi:hypothetical protein
MLDKQNIVVDGLESPPGNKGVEYQVAHEAYLKMVDYLRLTQAKNTLNRLSDYHYLNIAVSNSTEPVRGIDYISPVVSPGIDYSTAVITKCLMPNGKLNFEFERFSESDSAGAQQAAKMALHFINSKNDSYAVIRDWAQDALLHKNGVVMIKPIRDKITQYKEVEGTKDQLRSFEIMAAEKGLVAKRQQMRRVDVDLQGVVQEVMGGEDPDMSQPSNPEDVQDAVRNNTIYRAKYKMTGYSTNIQIKHVANITLFVIQRFPASVIKISAVSMTP